ncbi:MAG: TetR/AcrR family transcriptional regulator [Rhodospirillales bacterium]
MGRPREFDKTEALSKATEVFWLKGYEASSLKDLIDAMGISKSSFYETYGCKQDLFLSSIDHYANTALKDMVLMLESDMPGREAIAQVFLHTANRFITHATPMGCLLSNSAAELAPDCEPAKNKVVGYFQRAEEAFTKAVERGQQEGTITTDQEAKALGRFLVSSMNGLQVVGKANQDEQTLKDIVTTIIKALD